MNRTSIEWVKNPDSSQGYTWNPITGCLNGCSYCYARRLANGRLKQRYLANKNLAPFWNELFTGEEASQMVIQHCYNDPFYPRFWPERLGEPIEYPTPMRPAKRKGIFVCDMGELFGDWINQEWQEQVFTAIKLCPYHRFYLLTKQPQNLAKFSPFPDNCWVGVTVTNEDMMIEARKGLDNIWAKVRFISFEPLLGRLSRESLRDIRNLVADWFIIGSQTKPYRPPEKESVREIVSAAARAGTPIFLKDNLLELVNYVDKSTEFAFNKEGYYRQEMPNG